MLRQLGWSSVQQVFRITRVRKLRERVTGELNTTTEVVYGITDLTRDQADAERLLDFNRSHWGIENKIHHARDVTFGEDLHQAKGDNGPHVLAAMRNTAIAICRLYKYVNLAEARRIFAWDSQRLFDIFGYVKK